MENETKINLTLTLAQVNVIMASLGKQPYEAVFPAVEEIKKEAENLSPNVQKKIEDLRNLFEQSLKSSKKGGEGKKN